MAGLNDENQGIRRVEVPKDDDKLGSKPKKKKNRWKSNPVTPESVNNDVSNDIPSGGNLNDVKARSHPDVSDSGVKGVRPQQNGFDIDVPNEQSDTVPTKRSGIGGMMDSVVNGVKTGAHVIGDNLKDLGQNALHGLNTAGLGFLGFGRTVFQKMGGAIGLSPTTTGIITAIILGAVGVTGGIFYTNYQRNELIVRQDVIEDDCGEEVEEMRSYESTGDVSAQQLEAAKKIWAVGKAIGLTDEQCAGMLGNFTQESGVDPSTIEGIYDEPFNPDGPKHVSAREDLCTYFRTSLGPKYGSSGYTDENGHTFGGGGGSPHIDVAFYVSPKSGGGNGCFAPGIGLAQFTGYESGKLQTYAKAANRDWWDLDVQLAFIVAPVANGGYDKGEWLRSDWKAQAGNPRDAAYAFLIHFEGIDFAREERQSHAVMWYTKLKGYTDNAYAQSILEMANTVMATGSGNAAADAEEDCNEIDRQYDNSDIARAAVAYAYETTDQGRGNNGTELYQLVHDAVFPGDTYYQSCDRGVTTAVRWSGADDNIEPGYTDSLDLYFRSLPGKWETVGEFDGNIDNLQPGDILNTTSGRRGSANGHIVVYVSNEIVREKFPNSNASFVSASLNTRSPGCETYTSGKFVGEGYYVYRCVQKEANPKYTNVAEGFHGRDR